MTIKNNKNNKIVVILGPTSSGKTGLAVKLAYKFNGEVVSADSRQVYRGMDIGTGKDLDEYELEVRSKKLEVRSCEKKKVFKIVKVPYHLIDVVSPNTEFSLAKYQKLAYKAINDILNRGKLPILAGGSGLYLQAVVDNYNLSKIKPNKDLRKRLEKLSANELFKKLQKLNKKFADRLNKSERKNKQRLTRYIEVANPSEFNSELSRIKKEYEFLLIGLSCPRKVLLERIYKRLIDRIEKENMIGEVERLHQQGVSWKRLKSFGLEYKYVSLYLKKKLNYEEMIEKLNISIRQFAKKQMSWFRRWERQSFAKAADCKQRNSFSGINIIYWVKSDKEVEKLVKKFLK